MYVTQKKENEREEEEGGGGRGRKRVGKRAIRGGRKINVGGKQGRGEGK